MTRDKVENLAAILASRSKPKQFRAACYCIAAVIVGADVVKIADLLEIQNRTTKGWRWKELLKVSTIMREKRLWRDNLVVLEEIPPGTLELALHVGVAIG